MADRIAHDHPTITTVPATLDRIGSTNRPAVHVSEPVDVDDDSVPRLLLSGSEYRARISKRTDGTTVIRGAFETPRMARNPGAGENQLQAWIDARDLSFGRTVHFDVVEPGFKYGLRAPGESATYSSGRPDEGLASIAENIESNR